MKNKGVLAFKGKIFPFSMQYDFEGRKDLVSFIKLVKEAGLHVVLRIGPYVCAEWNYG